MNTPQLQRTVFLLLLAAVSIAFLWVLAPLWGAVFWAVLMAILFHPLFDALCRRLKGRRNAAALLTLLAFLLIVVLPATLLIGALVNEAAALVERMRDGQIDFRAYAQQIMAALPKWLTDVMKRLDLVDVQSVMDRFSDGFIKAGQMLTGRALALGQNALMLAVNVAIMLYLMFFFLRDGRQLAALISDTVPMSRAQTRYLMRKFATVGRATVKGNVVVAVVQGMLGGLAFWALGVHGAVLWGVVMAVLSLLPAVGASLVWGAGGQLSAGHRVGVAGRGAGGLGHAGDRHDRQRAAPGAGGQGHQAARLSDFADDDWRPLALWPVGLCGRAGDCRPVHGRLGAVQARQWPRACRPRGRPWRRCGAGRRRPASRSGRRRAAG